VIIGAGENGFKNLVLIFVLISLLPSPLSFISINCFFNGIF
jgi:hypothetical protein